MQTGVQYLEINDEFSGMRLDNFLIRHFKSIPKSRIYRAIRSGEVRVNKKRAKAEQRLERGDELRLPPLSNVERPLQAVPPSLSTLLQQSIIFENDFLFVLNKPTGLSVHAGSGTRLGIIEAMRLMYPQMNLELVHRLDKETSGCLMIAKKRSSLKALQACLQNGKVKKTYCAWVVGHWPKSIQKIDMPLGHFECGSSGERRIRIDEEGKPSQTLVKILRCAETATLLECQLLTGRTHQIRVHLSSHGHSIIGDEKYGRRSDNAYWREQGIEGMLLHASRLEIDCPALDLKIQVEAAWREQDFKVLDLVQSRKNP